MYPFLAAALKIALTATLVVSATLAAERMKPVWAGMIATIPLSSGAAHVMLSLVESDGFMARAGLGSAVTSIAAFAYLAIFVTLAPRTRAIVGVGIAFFTWVALALAFTLVSWTPLTAAIGNFIAFAVTFHVTRQYRQGATAKNRLRPGHREILLRGLAVGLLATVVSLTARLVGPTIAGLLAVFPLVYVTVAYIIHRRLGGKAASETMAAAVLPLLGVSATFLTLSVLAPMTGSALALVCAFTVSMLWSLAIAVGHLHMERKFAT